MLNKLFRRPSRNDGSPGDASDGGACPNGRCQLKVREVVADASPCPNGVHHKHHEHGTKGEIQTAVFALG